MSNECVLIFGSGGREHALAYRLTRASDGCVARKVIVCPGNDGIALEFECVQPEKAGICALVDVAKKIQPDLIVIGPENFLADALSDRLVEQDFDVFAPSQSAAQLESSKAFMKGVCEETGIATAPYRVCETLQDAEEFLATHQKKVVVKADGLCQGKGVLICENADDAFTATRKMLAISDRVVLEKYLEGHELSVIGICDGDDAVLFAPVRDHKQLYDEGAGPNTGGMGTVGPVFPNNDKNRFFEALRAQFFLPALRCLKKRGHPYKGFLFAGLMVSEGKIYLLEYNARMGDPEAQTLLHGTDVDLYPILKNIALGGALQKQIELGTHMKPTLTVVATSAGYPEAPLCGYAIRGLNNPELNQLGHVFYSGVRGTNGVKSLVNFGGRVLAYTVSSVSLSQAIATCYAGLSSVEFEGMHMRTDIGKNLEF